MRIRTVLPQSINICKVRSSHNYLLILTHRIRNKYLSSEDDIDRATGIKYRSSVNRTTLVTKQPESKNRISLVPSLYNETDDEEGTQRDLYQQEYKRLLLDNKNVKKKSKN